MTTGENNIYKLSKDYNTLYKHLCEGQLIVGFVDYTFKSLEDKCPPSRDICLIKRRKEFDIYFGVRGIGYGSVSDYWKGKNTEIEVFVSECNRMNLEWIDPD